MRTAAAAACLVAALVLPGSRADAQLPAFLLKDIETASQAMHSNPVPFARIGPTTYFGATAFGIDGLWKTDGTPAGTELIREFEDLGFAVAPVLAGEFYFAATDAANGSELWKSDGTTAGTVMVKDIEPGATGSTPFFIYSQVFAGELYFNAVTSASGHELWKTDGTPAGTLEVADVEPGGGHSAPRFVTPFQGALYFIATLASDATVFVTDGTAAGTLPVAAASYSGADNLVASSNSLYFSATDPTAGLELFKSDGTGAGTLLVTDLNPGAASGQIDDLTAVGDKVFFEGSDGVNIRDLFVSDGTAAGTLWLRDGLLSFPGIDFGGVYYAGLGGLWKSDGTVAGTLLVHSIGSGGSVRDLTVADGRFYFEANDGISGFEPWVSDGTSAGTQLLADIAPGITQSFPDKFLAAGGDLLFRANNGVVGSELWLSDGTPAGTNLFLNLQPDVGTSNPFPLVSFGGEVLISAQTAATGTALWKSDGTEVGTVLLADTDPGTAGGICCFNPQDQGSFVLLAALTSGTTGFELWRTDGTTPGTSLVVDLSPTVFTSVFRTAQLPQAGGFLFFPNKGAELWTSDGTAIGTVKIADPAPGAFSSIAPGSSDVSGNLLFFHAGAPSDVSNGVWRSDGTAAGTFQVSSLFLGDTGVIASIGGGSVVFGVGQFSGDKELWISDGSAPGTSVLIDFGPGGAGPNSFRSFDDVAYFYLSSGGQAGLWRSDGTVAGTFFLGSTTFSSAFQLGSTIYFKGSDAANGSELWKTDGTPAGTLLVKDIVPGTAGSDPSFIGPADGHVIFRACDSAGCELWQSDGTDAGTTLLADIRPGSADSSPQSTLREGPLVFFSANTDEAGREVWAVPASPDRSFTQLSGSAVGERQVQALILGVLVSVATSAGQSAEQIAEALRDAINADPTLMALGVVAFSSGADVILGGANESQSEFFSSDPGIALDPGSFVGAVPALPLAALPLLGILLVWAARRSLSTPG